MREVIDDEGRKFRPASVLGAAAMAIIGAAIIYNSLFAQTPIGSAGTTRLDVKADIAVGRTVQLKYQPAVEEVQRQLLASGYYKGPVDGVTGKRTRQAIEAYQQAMGLKITGEPTTGLAEHIRYTRQITEASLFTGSIEEDPDAAMRAQIRRVQTGLAELAYSPGEISGDLTGETRAAIRQFQNDRGLEETGEISGPLLAELSKLSGQSELNAD